MIGHGGVEDSSRSRVGTQRNVHVFTVLVLTAAVRNRNMKTGKWVTPLLLLLAPSSLSLSFSFSLFFSSFFLLHLNPFTNSTSFILLYKSSFFQQKFHTLVLLLDIGFWVCLRETWSILCACVCGRERAMAGRDLESGGTKNNRAENYSAPPAVSSYSYDPETHWTSWLVPMFVVANIAVFIVAMYINNCPKNNFGFQGDCVARFLGRFSFQPLQENPLLGPSSSTLTKMGALKWDSVVNRHQGWRLVSCIWLHAGIIHLLANMLSLVFIGIRLEQQFGFVRIGLIYLLSGFGGSVLSTLFIRNNISVGASGALFGLLGAMLSELLTNWTIYSNKAMALLTLLVIIVINLAIGILPHVDNFAHIGGFLTGFLLGFILLPRPQFGWLEQRHLPAGVRLKSKYKAYQYVLWIVSLVLLIAGLSIALVMLFRGENGYDHCHWCRYLTCVSTSKWKCNSDS